MLITTIGLLERLWEKLHGHPGSKAFFQLAKSEGADVFDRLGSA
jgi:hypothetical protein